MSFQDDFRSDTVTRPGKDMRAVMADADVGDAVYDDCPTTHRLETMAAERLGKDASLFFPTGTQSNLAGLMTHCGRGDEYIVGQMAHTYRNEGGGAAVLGSIQPQPLPNEADGSISLAAVEAAIKPDDFHFARTRLLALENTFNGLVLPWTIWRKPPVWQDVAVSQSTWTARACSMQPLRPAAERRPLPGISILSPSAFRRASARR